MAAIWSVSMPLMAASVGLSATARIALPSRVKVSSANSAATTTTDIARSSSCCGPTRRPEKRQSRVIGRSKFRSALPKPRRTTFSSAMVSATEAMVVVMSPAGRNGRSTSVSLAKPTTPATMNAITAAGSSARPSQTLAQ